MTTSGAADPAGQSKTVLVVEDNDGLRELVRQVLDDAGYEVVTARGREEAHSAWDRGRGSIDLLLTDISLADGDGAELARELASAGPGLEVLVMSGHDELSGATRGLPGSFLAKPFDVFELTRRVDELLQPR